jgi:hypothetical protein
VLNIKPTKCSIVHKESISERSGSSKKISKNRILAEEKDDLSSLQTAKGYQWMGAMTIQQVIDRTQGKGPVPETDVIQREHLVHSAEKFFYDFSSVFIEHSNVAITIKKNWLSAAP